MAISGLGLHGSYRRHASFRRTNDPDLAVVMSSVEDPMKKEVWDFWEGDSCGRVYAVGETARERYEAHERARYELEPYIERFARFEEAEGQDVLEGGVGMGADHLRWARSNPASLTGVDVTRSAVDHTATRLNIWGRSSLLSVADCEHLPYEDSRFDLVYSWGVIHHTPDTRAAVSEIHRVLRRGGKARVMIYHERSIVGALLWLRYALLRGRPWRSLRDVYHHHLESPRTKAYTVSRARSLFAEFEQVRIDVQLSFGDLLQGEVGQHHGGLLLDIARRLWPRPLIRSLFRRYGLYLLIEARK